MKKICISAVCLIMSVVSMGACKGEEEIGVKSSVPEEIVAYFDEDAVVNQFGTATWQTTVENGTVKKLKKAFVGGGYTDLNAPMVSGKKQQTKVLALDDKIVTLYQQDGDVKVVWDSCEESVRSLLLPNGDTGKGSVTMAQIGVERAGASDNPGIGMCYIYKLSDGRAVILDGGLGGNADNIYATLEKLDVAKDEAGRYRIAAWVLSHGHIDHYGAFVAFAERYQAQSDISYILYSFPIDENILPSWDCNVPWLVGFMNEYYPEAVQVTPHAGLRYHFGNLTLHMLYSPEMLSEINYTNDTSLIFIAECNGAKVLQTGDAGEDAAKVTWLAYEEKAFQADALQITHHGLYTSAYNNFHWEYLGYIYNATKATYGLLPMGTRSPVDSRNGRYTVINEWAWYGYQTSFLVNNQETETNSIWYGPIEYELFVEEVAAGTSAYKTLYGYDGKNMLINSNGLQTYIMSTETENMATVFTLSDGEMKVVANELLTNWLS